MKVFVKIFTKFVDGTKNESFFQYMNIKINLNIFGDSKLKFQPREYKLKICSDLFNVM